MYTFYVVVRHNSSGVFSPIRYQTENEILKEWDLLKIEEFHAEKRNGVVEVKTQIISWQRLDA
jgi:hypothetical protein